MRLFVLFGLLFGLVFAFYLRQGGWMMMSPTYSSGRLRGLTSAQVVGRLGPPDFDNWRPGVRATGPMIPPTAAAVAAYGLHVIGYIQGFGTCRIELTNDRVSKVQRYGK